MLMSLNNKILTCIVKISFFLFFYQNAYSPKPFWDRYSLRVVTNLTHPLLSLLKNLKCTYLVFNILIGTDNRFHE